MNDPIDPRVERILRGPIRERMDREHVRSTLEAPGWRVLFERAIKPTLDDWRCDLLTRLEMPEDERRGLIQARRLVLEGIRTSYETAGAHIPEWFEQELAELERPR